MTLDSIRKTRTCEADRGGRDYDGTWIESPCGAEASIVITLLATAEAAPHVGCLADGHTSDACVYGGGETLACRVGQVALCLECEAAGRDDEVIGMPDYGVVVAHREWLCHGMTAYEASRAVTA